MRRKDKKQGYYCCEGKYLPTENCVVVRALHRVFTIFTNNTPSYICKGKRILEKKKTSAAPIER